jgi:hypothetical protein
VSAVTAFGASTRSLATARSAAQLVRVAPSQKQDEVRAPGQASAAVAIAAAAPKGASTPTVAEAAAAATRVGLGVTGVTTKLALDVITDEETAWIEAEAQRVVSELEAVRRAVTLLCASIARDTLCKRTHDLLGTPTALAACCGLALCHKYSNICIL